MAAGCSGAGAVAGGNIAWDASGNVTFALDGQCLVDGTYRLPHHGFGRQRLSQADEDHGRRNLYRQYHRLADYRRNHLRRPHSGRQYSGLEARCRQHQVLHHQHGLYQRPELYLHQRKNRRLDDRASASLPRISR